MMAELPEAHAEVLCLGSVVVLIVQVQALPTVSSRGLWSCKVDFIEMLGRALGWNLFLIEFVSHLLTHSCR